MKYNSKRNKKSCEEQQGGVSALGTWSPWACLTAWLDSAPCCPAAEQLVPAAPRSWGRSIFQLHSQLVGLGGSVGSRSGLVVN